MTTLLAHHLEGHHLPILICLFAAGFYIGWSGVSRWMKRRGQKTGSTMVD